MNYSDFPDLQVDSFCGTRFGDQGQVEVIGWSGVTVRKLLRYVVKCSVCSQDAELYGDGVFRTLKAELIRGKIPCGCARNPRYTESQLAVRLKREAAIKGEIFNGFVGEFLGNKTVISVICQKHGEFATTRAHTYLYARANTGKSSGCPQCSKSRAGLLGMISDDLHIEDFMASGKFVTGTTFTRDPTRSPSGRNLQMWVVCCGDCGEIYTGQTSNLKVGNRGCSCAERARFIPDEEHIRDIQSVGVFHPDTVFKRNLTRKSSRGDLGQYWDVKCGECLEQYSSLKGTLMKGSRGCGCSINSREAYVNIVSNAGVAVGVKFGIATVAKQRLMAQNRKTSLDVRQHGVWRFVSTVTCKAAERECKRELVCGIIPKTDMPDGWTETTYLYNIPAIEAIYRKHGGVRI